MKEDEWDEGEDDRELVIRPYHILFTLKARSKSLPLGHQTIAAYGSIVTDLLYILLYSEDRLSLSIAVAHLEMRPREIQSNGQL